MNSNDKKRLRMDISEELLEMTDIIAFLERIAH